MVLGSIRTPGCRLVQAIRSAAKPNENLPFSRGRPSGPGVFTGWHPKQEFRSWWAYKSAPLGMMARMRSH